MPLVSFHNHFLFLQWITILVSFLIYFSNVTCGPLKLKPIVIVPGIGGSQVEGFLNRTTTKHYWCYRKSVDWFTLWLNIEELFPMTKECWIDNMKLVYNPVTRKMENTPGVLTRTPAFGNTTSIEWLDPSVHGPGVYFYPFVQSLVKMGYKRGHNLLGAPYDFRYDPGSAGAYFVKLKKLIEDAYHKSGSKIILVSHSMGAPYTLYFFKHQSQQWKDTFIDTWVTISGAYGGSVNAVLAFVSGYGFGIPSLLDKPLTLRQFERTYSSLPYLLPDPDFWDKEEILIKTENKTYGVKDWGALFDDLKYPVAKKVLNSVPKIWLKDPPNIKTYCFYGTQVNTAVTLKYRAGYFPDYYPDIVYESGDGTVPLRSLQACKHWVKTSKKNVTIKTFSMAEHNGILADNRLLTAFLDILHSEP